MIEFAGRVHEVQCITARHGSGRADDTTTLLLRFESGVTGTLFCSVATATSYSLSTYGTKGMAEISGAALQRVRLVPLSEHAPVGPVTAPPDKFIEHTGFNMLKAELQEFARCIRDKQPYPVDINEVLHGMAVFDAAKDSARSGGIVAVSNR